MHCVFVMDDELVAVQGTTDDLWMVYANRRRRGLQPDAEANVMRVRLGLTFEGAFVKRIVVVIAMALWLGSKAPIARGQSPAAPAGVNLDQLLGMSAAELETVYRKGASVAIPEGRIRGTAILAPGTRRTRALSRGARLMWQGKVFEPGQTSAVNRFFGMRLVRAQVYQGSSWLDGQPSLILDYIQTSRVYENNRDEIRQVAPGLFLGLMYDRTTSPPGLVMYFALESRP
jgi:hypothetical protein